jgi:hypothetical protein
MSIHEQNCLVQQKSNFNRKQLDRAVFFFLHAGSKELREGALIEGFPLRQLGNQVFLSLL